MALVIVLSVFNGFDTVVKSLFSTFDPDIHISSMEEKTFTPDQHTTQAILSILPYTLFNSDTFLLSFTIPPACISVFPQQKS